MTKRQNNSQLIATLNELLDLLDEERLALCTAYPDGPTLNRLAEQKRQCFDSLEDMVEEFELAPDSGKVASAPREDSAYLNFLDKLRRVQQANNLNGELLHSRMVWNQQMLNLINDSRNEMVYHANGKSSRNTSQYSSIA